MLARYHRYLFFFSLALALNLLFFYWTKILVSLESVVKAHRQLLYLPPPIQLTHPTTLTWNLKNLTSPPPVQLISAIASLASPATPIDPNTHAITLKHRLHPVFIDARNSYWNPSIISLPSGASAQYLLLARVLTNGLHQQTISCYANWTEEFGSLNCIGKLEVLDIAPTAARLCGQANSSAWEVLANIPGLHDARVMWTDRGEVLMMGGTQSRYTCFSLSLLTLSAPGVFHPLHALLPNSPISYPVLTELRRPPPYAPMEKNWLLFFSPEYGTYAQYELSPGKRTFVKLIGNGYITQNLTSPLEAPCLGFPYPITLNPDSEREFSGIKKDGWHQATNSLRLVLCDRRDLECQGVEGMEVFIAVVQRKRHNRLGLVSRYERVVVVWEGKPPFRIVGVGKARILFEGEDRGFSQDTGATTVSTGAAKYGGENGIMTLTSLLAAVPTSTSTITRNSLPVPTDPLVKRRFRQHFTFMVSIAFDHTRRRKEEGGESHVGKEPEEMYMGYLDDYLIAGLGIGDEEMGVARLRVRELVSGVAVCPGFEN